MTGNVRDEMNETIKTLWTTALRSGKYLQGRGYLKTVEHGETRLCCLGVLCELAIEAGVTIKVDTERLGEVKITTFNGEELMPPKEVMEWAGLAESDAQHYVEMNDDEGQPFAETAAYIETYNR